MFNTFDCWHLFLIQIYLIMKSKSLTHLCLRHYTIDRTMTTDTLKLLRSSYPQSPYSFLPIRFTAPIPPPPNLWQRLTPHPPPITSIFSHLLSFLQTPTAPHEFIEPNFKSVYLKNLLQHKSTVKVLRGEILACSQFDVSKLYGVFMHRELNMHNDCYSFEEAQNCAQIKYRMKGRFGREADMAEQMRVKKKYEEEQWDRRVYVESYDRFVHKEYVLREIYRIDCNLEIQLHTPNGIEWLGKDVRSRHYLQLERIYYPYTMTDMYLTDCDFFLKGNPHTRDQNEKV